jgi:hypothetical protein
MMMQRPDTHAQTDPGQSGHDSDPKDVVREEGQELQQQATREARAVAHTVGEEASVVAQEVALHARDLADDAKQQLHRQAREQTDHLGGALDQLGDRVHALAEGRPEDAGPVGQYVDRIADQVDELAGRVNTMGFDGLVDELQRFARRRPGAFLAGAALAGFAVSRLGRGVQAVQQDQEQDPARAAAPGAGHTQPAVPAGVPSAARQSPASAGAASPAVEAPPAVPPVPAAAGGTTADPLFEGAPRDRLQDDAEVTGPETAPPAAETSPDPLRSGQVRP